MNDVESDYYRQWFLEKFKELGIEPIPIDEPLVKVKGRVRKTRKPILNR